MMSRLTAAEPRSPLEDRPGYHARLSTSSTHLAICTDTFQLRLEVLALDLIGRPIPNCTVDPLSVVPDFDVLEDPSDRLSLRPKSLEVHEFSLEHTVERFHTSIVIAISFSTHACRHPIGFESVLIRLRRILAPTIRMVQDNAVALQPAFLRLLQGADAQLFRHPRTCAPTHNLTAV